MGEGQAPARMELLNEPVPEVRGVEQLREQHARAAARCGCGPSHTLPCHAILLLQDCHLEENADYDGPALTWGMSFRKASASQCCQACKQRKEPQADGMRCNVWVSRPPLAGAERQRSTQLALREPRTASKYRRPCRCGAAAVRASVGALTFTTTRRSA